MKSTQILSLSLAACLMIGSLAGAGGVQAKEKEKKPKKERTLEEQKRIASFLQRLDDQMKLHQHQFERLKQLKSACLDSMFPQQSENTPHTL